MAARAPFNNTTLFPTVTVEAGFASSTSGFGVWDATLWDTALWGPDTVWTDITDYLYTAATNRGRGRETQRYDAGLLTLTLKNQDDRFSPLNLAGPYVTGGITQIRPGVPIRVRATWNAITYPIFYGLADVWQDGYAEQGKLSTTTVTVVDMLAALAAVDLPAVTPVGAGDLAGARIARIAVNAGFDGALVLDAGYNTMQASAMAQPALQDIGLTADSDGGLVWADGEGSIVFHDQFAALTKTRSNTVQFTFGPGVGEVPYTDPQTAYDTTLIFNTLSFARVGGSAITAVDTDSQALYKTKTYNRLDLICQTDAQVGDLENFHLAKFKQPELRVVGATVPPPGTAAQAAVQWPLVLGALFRDRVTFKLTGPGATAMSFPVFVDGISHMITVDGGWRVRFQYASATAYAQFISFGTWDSGVWDSSVWLP